MFVKICGTTNLADARLAVELGADALGFIFAPSKRRVSGETAASILRELSSRVLSVGVFTQPDPEEIGRTVSEARLGAVQMHWAYDFAVIEALRGRFGRALELWQVVGFRIDAIDAEEAEREFTRELRVALLDSRLDRILLDAVKGGASGGLGQAFSWERAAAVVKALLLETGQVQRGRGLTLPYVIVAGGLHAENVREAIDLLQPWGVDVVSGVEASPGKKSPDRLARFMDAAKRSCAKGS